MSLFVINRYGEKTPSKENENIHLANLLQKIEERKQQRSASNSESKSSKKKQKLKHSLSKNEENENTTDNNNQNVDIKLVNNEDEIPITNGTSNSIEKEHETHNNFPILGIKFKKKQKHIDRVLPYWLAHPQVISTDINSGPNLDELNCPLDSKLIDILKLNGVSKLFPVQEYLISWLLNCNNDRKIGYWPRDTCVSAPTGSGKTLAYILPIVQQLQSRLVPKIRCLIVLPVQELAAQVYKVAIAYTQHTNLKIQLLTGASSFEIEQASLMKKFEKELSPSEVDIVVATPGRLVDHILKTPGFSLDALQFLVIDEADRTADWIQYLPTINSHTSPFIMAKKYSREKPPVQKLLFSATLSQDPEKLNHLGLFQPILFTTVGESEKQNHLNTNSIDFIGRYTSPQELIERAIECPTELKPIALYHILTREMPNEKILIFTNSGETSHRLALLIQSLLVNKTNSVGEISSQLAPKQRENVLKKFDNGEIQILVSSDALARGLDFPNVTLVISYDLPKHIKGYIHRSGRTGRAGKSGTAISILTSDQIEIFQKLLGGAHKTVPVIEKIADLQDLANEIDYQKHVGVLKNILEKEKDKAIKRLKTAKRKRLNSS